MDFAKIFGYNQTPIRGTQPVTTGNGWNVGATGGVNTTTGGQNGNSSLIARLDAIDNQLVRPTAFLGETKDFYA